MAKIGVFTKDDFLYRKIMLDAPAGTEVRRWSTDADIILCDIDTESLPHVECITMSRRGEADIAVPFRLGTVAALLTERAADGKPLTLDADGRCAHLYGESIKLTEVEFSLFSLLYERGGEFASRDEILNAVWGDGVDAGIINVYIHYLREKLETHGEKVIISSRRSGYKIDERYFGGNR